MEILSQSYEKFPAEIWATAISQNYPKAGENKSSPQVHVLEIPFEIHCRQILFPERDDGHKCDQSLRGHFERPLQRPILQKIDLQISDKKEMPHQTNDDPERYKPN